MTRSRSVPFSAATPWAIAALAALLVTLAGAGPAGAQVVRASDYLARMDVDGDGRVSLTEYQDWLSYAFDDMDRNRDGVLTPDELPGGKPARGPGRTITRAEHRARLASAFNRQDANRDGHLDASELAAPPAR